MVGASLKGPLRGVEKLYAEEEKQPTDRQIEKVNIEAPLIEGTNGIGRWSRPIEKVKTEASLISIPMEPQVEWTNFTVLIFTLINCTIS